MMYLATFLGVVGGIILDLAITLVNASWTGAVLWIAWNYGVVMIGHSPRAPYWACVAVSLGLTCIASMFRARTMTAAPVKQ